MDESIDIHLRTAQYVQLRDKIREIKKGHEAELEPYQKALDKLGAMLLDHLNTINVDSCRTKGGTCYKSLKKSASIADGSVFRSYVIQNQLWDIVDWRANAPAVEEALNRGETVPGVNFSVYATVNVRK